MMKNKRLFNKLILLIVAITVSVLLVACAKPTSIQVIHHNGQYGVVSNRDINNLKINDKDYELYSTIKDNVELHFESYNLDNEYSNSVEINGFKYKLETKGQSQNEFVNNKLSILGLVINSEKVKVNIKTGVNMFNTYDNFWLRNISLLVGQTEIWPTEFPKEEYINEVFKFGPDTLTTNHRAGYNTELNLTFDIPNEVLNDYGTLLNESTKELDVSYDKIETKLINPSYLEINTQLNQDDLIGETFKLDVTGEGLTNYLVYMDNVEIAKELTFNKNSWSPGDHEIVIVGTNQYDFKKVVATNIELKDYDRGSQEVEFEFYETGHNEEKAANNKNLGVSVNYESGYESPFSKYSIQNFHVKESESKDFVWEGSAPLNRTLTMEVYNNKTNKYDVVSVNKVLDEAKTYRLGFNYEGKNDWIDKGYLDIRVTSSNLENELNYDAYIYHVSDPQYIVQQGNGKPGIITDRAKKALNDMSDEIIRAYAEDNLLYTMVTGDLIQSILNFGEWDVFMDEFLNPILDPNHPIGVLAGNHDVGGTSDWNFDGGNAFDDVLSYESYYENVGADVFEDYDWYGGSFENNRSHYDLIDIQGETYLFLHLGWGSDRWGVHVSSKDVNYGKTVLQEHPDKKVIILSHEYLNNRGKRTATGNFIFDELVKPFSNVLMVFSGHINGSTYLIDHIDDDNDGISDRRVLQSLTNFQEEENLYGATFIRKLGLDFVNNKIGFELYSPYYKDNDIHVIHHPDIVKRDRNFMYDFDFNQLGYGLITYEIK